MNRSTLTVALSLCCALASCVETATQATGEGTTAATTRRTRPRRSAARRALNEAAANAASCLPTPDARAQVEGAFIGSTGLYRIEGITGQDIGRESRNCIRDAFAEVRVAPFTNDRYEIIQVIQRQADDSSGSSTASANPDAAVTAVNAIHATVAPDAATATVASSTRSADSGAAGDSRAQQLQAFAAVIRLRTDNIRQCYAQQLAHDPQLRARVRVRYTVDAAGSVSAASSTSVVEAGDPALVSDLARCVEGVIRGATFAARPGGTAVDMDMPFNFAPAQTAATDPPVSTDATQLTGRVDSDRVSAAIRSRMASLSGCYSRNAAMTPGLVGRVTVRFVIQSSGRVTDVTASSTASAGPAERMDAVAQCVQQTFTHFTLPPPSGGPASITLPLDFGQTP
jgi:TonB family protein